MRSYAIRSYVLTEMHIRQRPLVATRRKSLNKFGRAVAQHYDRCVWTATIDGRTNPSITRRFFDAADPTPRVDDGSWSRREKLPVRLTTQMLR